MVATTTNATTTTNWAMATSAYTDATTNTITNIIAHQIDPTNTLDVIIKIVSSRTTTTDSNIYGGCTSYEYYGMCIIALINATITVAALNNNDAIDVLCVAIIAIIAHTQ